MTGEGNGQLRRYAVDMSGHTRAALKELHGQARQAGKSKRFLAAIRQIIERLQRDPLGLGDPLYRLPAMKVQVCQAVVDMVVVHYAVHEEKPLVFIQGFKALDWEGV